MSCAGLPFTCDDARHSDARERKHVYNRTISHTAGGPRFLTENGYPIGKSTIDKLSMPSRGDERPPPAGFWGNRALYDPNKVLAWAKARFRTNWRGSG